MTWKPNQRGRRTAGTVEGAGTQDAPIRVAVTEMAKNNDPEKADFFT